MFLADSVFDHSDMVPERCSSGKVLFQRFFLRIPCICNMYFDEKVHEPSIYLNADGLSPGIPAKISLICSLWVTSYFFPLNMKDTLLYQMKNFPEYVRNALISQFISEFKVISCRVDTFGKYVEYKLS